MFRKYGFERKFVFKMFQMEESAYIPNSIPPGLVIFSQPGYGDAMRLQRPFNSQVKPTTNYWLSQSHNSSMTIPVTKPQTFF